MTVLDWFSLADAHARYHAPPVSDSTVDGSRTYSRTEAEALQAAMRRAADADEGKAWRPV